MGQQLQAVNQHLRKVGKEVRISFRLLRTTAGQALNAEAKLSKPGAGPESCTKPSQVELEI